MARVFLAATCSGLALSSGAAGVGRRGAGDLRRLAGVGGSSAGVVGSGRRLGPPGAVAIRLRRAAEWARGRLVRQRSSSRAEQPAELLEAFAAELRSGAAPSLAFERAAGEIADETLGPELAQVAEMVRLGSSGPAALRLAADAARDPELAWLAAAWELAEDRGTALASAVTRVAAAARAEQRHRATVRAELAGPRTSARMLAALPAVGLGLGAALGADPVRVLVSSPAGVGCLVAAGVLEAAGLRWTSALIDRAERVA